MHFNEKLKEAIRASGSVLVAGLDPVTERLPSDVIGAHEGERTLEFCKGIIKAVQDSVCGFKINLGFFEALGPQGLSLFMRVRERIPAGKIIIADAKRGDIGNTAERYAHAFYESFDCDAVTVNPLMGFDTLTPFIHDRRKCAFILTLTSNPGSADIFLQKLETGKNLSSMISTRLRELQSESAGTIGMVIGATHTEHYSSVLPQFPQAPLLMPGIGPQGGDIDRMIQSLENHKGIVLPVISRAIIYASNGEDWKEAASEKARHYKKAFEPLLRHVR